MTMITPITARRPLMTLTGMNVRSIGAGHAKDDLEHPSEHVWDEKGLETPKLGMLESRHGVEARSRPAGTGMGAARHPDHDPAEDAGDQSGYLRCVRGEVDSQTEGKCDKEYRQSGHQILDRGQVRGPRRRDQVSS